MSLKDIETRMAAMEARFATLLDKSVTLAAAALEQSKATAATVAAINVPQKQVASDTISTDVSAKPEMVEVTNESLFPFTLPNGALVGPARSTEVDDIPNRVVVPKSVVECASMKAMIDPPSKNHPRIFTIRPVA